MSDPDLAAASEPLKSNRPENSKFKQQKLDAWQPILTPGWVVGTFLVVGCVFVPVGAYLYNLSQNLFEASVAYDSSDPSSISTGVPSECQINNINQGYTRLTESLTASFTSCQVSMTVTQDISDNSVLYLYYQLDRFYQNHRRYVQSVSKTQLDNSVAFPIGTTGGSSYTSLKTDCNPDTSFSNTTSSFLYYPCGLIALSVFNDGITLAKFERPSGSGAGTIDYNAGIPVSYSGAFTSAAQAPLLSTKNVAWTYDLDNKFSNPTATDCGSKTSVNTATSTGNLCPQNYYQYQYLWQTYSQFVCYPEYATGVPNVTAAQTPCTTWNDYVNNFGNAYFDPATWSSFTSSRDPITIGGCAGCATGSVLTSAGGILPPNAGLSPETMTNATSSDGVRDEHFVVWMRTAGLPTFRKLYGTISAPGGSQFKNGDILTFNIIPNFLVQNISATKSLVIGTVSPLGGKNNVLGIAYITVGSICLFLAIVFAIKIKVAPRRLGDPQYLQWNKQ